MASTTNPISSPLRQAAELKIDQFNLEKEAFKKRHKSPTIDEAKDSLARVVALLDGITKLDPHLEGDEDLDTIRRYTEQAKNDRSFSETKLNKLEQQLRDRIALQLNRLEVTSLHVDLLKEAMYADRSVLSMSAKLEKAALEEGFEMVENELDNAIDNFERNTLQAKDVDTEALEAYLEGLFEKDPRGTNLQRLRDDICLYADEVFNGIEEIDDDTLEWCINDLIAEGMVSDDKKAVLQGYLQSPQAIRELRSTLNLKSIRHWNWKDAEKGLQVIAQQNGDGKYCITVDEDIIDMLFLHTIATGFGMKLKECLTDLTLDTRVWPRNKDIPFEEMDKREYYLMSMRAPLRRPKGNVCTMCHVPPPAPYVMTPAPMPPMSYGPPPPPPMVDVIRARKPRRRVRPMLPLVGFNLNEERFRHYMRDFFLERLPKKNGASPEITPVKETQANLIKHLATELKMRAALDGNVRCVTGNFESFAASLPHKTILTMLKFIGMPEKWLTFFTRFLEAPLDMGDLTGSEQVVTRKNGVPIAHAMEVFFGELVLFFLDLDVHKATGQYLYRLRDEYFVPCTDKQVMPTMDAIARFENATGLSSQLLGIVGGTVSIGFVDMSLNSDEPIAFSIDMNKVEAEAYKIEKKLSECTTVLDWIRTWNETMGPYAAHQFGPLAEVFGQTHLRALTDAYNRMHEIIFGDSNLTDHVKQLLRAHVRPTLSDPPFSLDPLLYLPAAYGGLGIKNPYVTLNLAREMNKDPSSAITKFLESERLHYEKAAYSFSILKPEVLDRKLEEIFNEDKDAIAKAFGETDRTQFMSFEEFVSHRDAIPYPVVSAPIYPNTYPPHLAKYTPVPAIIPVYNMLLSEPLDHIQGSDRVQDEVRACARRGLDMKHWRRLRGEDRWVLQLYSDECFERYGGLEIWIGGALPMEALRIVRGEEETAADDDSSSYSSEV